MTSIREGSFGSTMVRLFDILASLAGLAVTLPLYSLMALAIKLDSPGPVFYRQVRVGLDGRPFTILKFRTMVNDAEREGSITVKEDTRVTRVGRWFRRFEVDELPTLLNVLKGDMSIVGPRPEVPEYVQLYTQEQRRVLSVRPGITSHATLRFRNEAEFLSEADDLERAYLDQVMPEKIRLSLDYINRRSILFDLRIIFETLFLVVRQSK